MRRVKERGSGEIEVGEELEFLARVRGWSEEEHSERTGELLATETGAALCRSVVKKECILHIPASYYPRETPKYGVKTGWWYTLVEEVRCKRCKGCDKVQAQDDFNFDEWQKVTGSRCRKGGLFFAKAAVMASSCTLTRAPQLLWVDLRVHLSNMFPASSPLHFTTTIIPPPMFPAALK